MTAATVSGPNPHSRLSLALLLAGALASAPAVPAAAAGYAEGTPILINGVVTDTEGQPVPAYPRLMI